MSVDFGGFFEKIDKRAFDGVIDKSDVFALLDHDWMRGILARSRYGEGSLELKIDDIGLRYAFDAPHTALGDELLEMLSRGDVKESSFAFVVDDDKVEQIDGKTVRTIVKISELFDVSPVYQPAYPDTSVALRSIEKAKVVEPEYYDRLNQYIEE